MVDRLPEFQGPKRKSLAKIGEVTPPKRRHTWALSTGEADRAPQMRGKIAPLPLPPGHVWGPPRLFWGGSHASGGKRDNQIALRCRIRARGHDQASVGGAG